MFKYQNWRYAVVQTNSTGGQSFGNMIKKRTELLYKFSQIILERVFVGSIVTIRMGVFFLGSWGNKQIALEPLRGSRDLFVARSYSFPMNPDKKDTHSLNEMLTVNVLGPANDERKEHIDGKDRYSIIFHAKLIQIQADSSSIALVEITDVLHKVFSCQ